MMFRFVVSFAVFLLVGCNHTGEGSQFTGRTESDRLNQFFEYAYQKMLQRDPEELSYRGDTSKQDQLNDYTESYGKETLEVSRELLKTLKTFDYDKLDAQSQLSYDMYVRQSEERELAWKWRHYKYVVNQMFGIQSGLPSYMISFHQVKTEADLVAYISRLNQFQRVYSEVVDQLKASEKAGVIPPQFVFPQVLSDIRNLQKGQPFAKAGGDSTLLKDFLKKLTSLNLPKEKADALKAQGLQALKSSVGPGFQTLEKHLVALEKRADSKAGVWKFPDGDEFYKYRLGHITSTNYTPEFVHKLGLMNVDRIHGEMRKIMKQVKFKGSLKDFFQFMKKDKRFYYPQNPAGEQKYLKLATGYIDSMRKLLPQMFSTLPKADLVVKPVEAFRAKTAGLAFYNDPAADGSRPGMYYVNLSNLKGLPTWEAEALAHHEGLPGHHMQLSIAQEMKSLPKFRRYMMVTAYTEGWGLYSEKLPVEFGAYGDPYSNFGRLSMELWRACRLVVDTGLHWKKWTRQQGIDFLAKNTPSDGKENRKAIDRYIVMPGQATGYMVGMLKILELRKKAKAQMGDKFDLRKFHDVILRNGSLPLDFLEKNVAKYVSEGVTS